MSRCKYCGKQDLEWKSEILPETETHLPHYRWVLMDGDTPHRCEAYEKRRNSIELDRAHYKQQKRKER